MASKRVKPLELCGDVWRAVAAMLTYHDFINTLPLVSWFFTSVRVPWVVLELPFHEYFPSYNCQYDDEKPFRNWARTLFFSLDSHCQLGPGAALGKVVVNSAWSHRFEVFYQTTQELVFQQITHPPEEIISFEHLRRVVFRDDITYRSGDHYTEVHLPPTTERAEFWGRVVGNIRVVANKGLQSLGFRSNKYVYPPSAAGHVDCTACVRVKIVDLC